MTTLAFIHTGSVVIPPTNDIVRRLMPGVRIVNFLDDSIVAEISRERAIVPPVRRRLERIAECASEAKADAIVITCSSISEMAGTVAEASGLPVFKIDEAMAEEAVRLGTRIGVLATLATTLDPTCRLIESKAQEAGKEITIRRELAHAAFEQLVQGNTQAHDQILRAALAELATTEDVIVLAQASMARLIDQSSRAGPVSILASPLLGLTFIRSQLAARGLDVG